MIGKLTIRAAAALSVAAFAVGLYAFGAQQAQQSGLSEETRQAVEQMRTTVASVQKILAKQKDIYSCCIKPGCVFCELALGACPCADRLEKGQGVCPECFGGWYAGQGDLGTKDDLTSKPNPLGADHLYYKGNQLKIVPLSLLRNMYAQRATALGEPPAQPPEATPPKQEPAPPKGKKEDAAPPKESSPKDKSALPKDESKQP